MKTKVLLLAAICGLMVPARAGVVVNSNFTLTPLPSSQYQFTVFQDEAATDYTDLIAILNGQTLTPSLWAIDEEADYYLVPDSAVFSAATIALGMFQPLLVLDHPTALNVPFGDFYLGINTGRGFIAPVQPNRDVFGWVHLVNNQQTGLTMVGNAVSYGSQGIIVGTTVTVPEPSAEMLFGLGICFALVVRRGRNFATIRAR